MRFMQSEFRVHPVIFVIAVIAQKFTIPAPSVIPFPAGENIPNVLSDDFIKSFHAATVFFSFFLTRADSLESGILAPFISLMGNGFEVSAYFMRIL